MGINTDLHRILRLRHTGLDAGQEALIRLGGGRGIASALEAKRGYE